MTFSLVAVDEDAGEVGVAAMTAMPGVGKLVAHSRAGIGATASQAFMNPYLAFDGLTLLSFGIAADVAVDLLIGADPGRDGRQFGLVDAQGRSAAFTGGLPEDWKGHRCGHGYAAQGNRLVGPQVLDAAITAYQETRGGLVERLLAALDAGEEAGGDRSGHRSATIEVRATEQYPLWDLRIDDAEDPLAQLRREYTTFRDELVPQIEILPTRDDPLGGFDYSGGGDGSI